ncbi:hypothetical protein [Acetobacter vaccinii]|uniref:hypothetical protein n=1 Tax=Acetobacter vaccinii TaxID=2592655 RepID=UPI001FEF2ACC|nr:hypothetical protein [Acetobacter vaccinii]
MDTDDADRQEQEAGQTVAEDIFREVDEELKAERLRRVAWRYAGVAVALVVVAASGVGVMSWRATQQARQAQVATGTYLTALQQTDHLPDPPATGVAELGQSARTGLDTLRQLAASGPAGVAVLARMQEAAVQAGRGDKAAALAAWDAVQSDAKADPALRDLATLIWCQQQLDTGSPAVLRSRLLLLSGKGKAWQGLATEALALLDVREGHLDDARRKFASLVASGDAPAGVRHRAQDMMQALDPSAG